MGRKRSAEDDRGRCAYCGRVTSSPAKPSYEASTTGAESSRWSHHRRRVLLAGVEVLPLCAFTRPKPGLSTVIV